MTNMQPLRFRVFVDVVRRYLAVWRTVWDMREQLERPPRPADQLAFLPAELELELWSKVVFG
jgi:hemolysin D